MRNKALIINYPSSEKDFRLPILKTFLEEYYIIDICINPFWGDYKTKTNLTKNQIYILKYAFKEIRYLFKLLFLISRSRYKLIIIGYPAYIEAFFLTFLLSKKKKGRVYIDFFISIYDTLILDRKLYPKNSQRARFFYSIDKRLLKYFKHIIVDTKKNGDRYSEIFRISKYKYYVLYVGSNNLIQNPSFEEKKLKERIIHVGWVGAIIPLHGLDEIIKCAKIVKDDKIKFHLIGNGPNNEIEQIKNDIDSFLLTNILIYDELDFESTMKILNKCDICLGIFGQSDKAKSVIPFKLFDYLYLNKPIITQNSDAILEISEFDQIYQVENKAIFIAKQIHTIDISQKINNRDLLIKILKKQYSNLFYSIKSEQHSKKISN